MSATCWVSSVTWATRILTIAYALIPAIVSGAGCTATRAPRWSAERSKLSEPLAREIRWAQAIQERDSLILEGLLAPDFLHITEAGSLVPRERWLENVLSVRETLLVELGDARDTVRGTQSDVYLTVISRPRRRPLPMILSLEQVHDRWTLRGLAWRVVERRTLRTSSYLWTGREDPR